MLYFPFLFFVSFFKMRNNEPIVLPLIMLPLIILIWIQVAVLLTVMMMIDDLKRMAVVIMKQVIVVVVAAVSDNSSHHHHPCRYFMYCSPSDDIIYRWRNWKSYPLPDTEPRYSNGWMYKFFKKIIPMKEWAKVLVGNCNNSSTFKLTNR